ncbi:MAG: hypothetical protein ABSE35_13545 [Bryobacteraceae bacterium]|jgi:hypothetical protein
MKYITLAVTGPVIREVSAGNSYQRQIAIRDASPGLLAIIRAATGGGRALVAVNGVFELSVGDSGAIWGAHQGAGLQAEDFASLFDLLARRPDLPVTFSWA